MSNIYHTEPPTHGKVLIQTTAGDIDIELWSKEAPLACRNFVQLCLEGYYDNSPFHRVIKDFMAQTGDPSGTGKGGESIWGKPFKDEIHGRIKFNHRGQVAMANENRPNTNSSQFFFTFGACEWLNRKHTIFGKVTGNTVYNLMRMNDVEVDANDRPVDPIRIVKTEVLWNPFEDIVPRAKKVDASVPTAAPAKSARKGKRDTKLLSFGEEEETAEQDIDESIRGAKIHSSHDSKLRDKRLSAQVSEDVLAATEEAAVPTSDASGSARGGGEDDALDFADQMRRKMLAKRKLHDTSKSKRGDNSDDDDDDAVDMPDAKTLERQKKTEEFNRMREDLLKSKRAIRVLTGGEAAQLRQEEAKHEMLTPLEQRRQRYIKRKHEHGNREDETMAKLQKFQESLRQAKKQQQASDDTTATAKAEPENKSMFSEVYTGQVLEKGSDDEEDTEGTNWLKGKLKFRKHIDDLYRMGGDGRSLEDYKVEDMRLKGYT